MDNRLTTQSDTQLNTVGQEANKRAGSRVFQEFTSRKSANTRALIGYTMMAFSKYLTEVNLIQSPDDLQDDPESWRAITWGIVKYFQDWMVGKGYSIGTMNLYLTYVRVFAGLAHTAGVISSDDLLRIRSISNYSHQEGVHLDEQRPITRRNNRKSANTRISQEQAKLLKSNPNTPQGRRDTLLMCLLLDLGLRCGEVMSLKVADVDMQAGTITIYRSKVDKVQTHRLLPDVYEAMKRYFEAGDAPTDPKSSLLMSSNGKSGGIGQWKTLTHPGMSRKSLSQRVRVLGKRIGLFPLSAHDCRHYWCTMAVRGGSSIIAMKQAGGWKSTEMIARYADEMTIANDGIKLLEEPIE